MHAEVEVRVPAAAAAISGNHGHGTMTEPRVHEPRARKFQEGDVGAMAHADVVHVQDHDARARRQAELLREAGHRRVPGS